MAGIRLEFAQFGDFDSFDIIRSDTSLAAVADVDLPSPIVTGLTTMYYADTAVVVGTTYYYKVRVNRDGVSAVSNEISVVADRDEHWDKVTALLHFNGNLNDETGLGVYSKTAGVSFSDTHALHGQAIKVSNTMDYVSTSGISTWQFGGNDFCIEFFVYPESVSGNIALITKWNEGVGSRCEFFLGISGGNMWFDVRANNGSTYVPLVRSAPPVINQLTHIAVTREGNTFRLFYDGVKKDEKVSTVIINAYSATPVRIGGPPIGSTWTFNGYIDEVRVTKGVARYTEGFTPPDTPFLSQ